MRLLIVAAPMVSRGGVYSWLSDATPILQEAGWTVGVVWTVRVPADPPAADWHLDPGEGKTRMERVRALPKAVEQAVDSFHPDHVLSLLPQSDLACALALRGRTLRWTAMVHGRPFPAHGEGRASRRMAWRAAVRWAYRRADQVVVVSGALGQALREDLAVKKATVVHNGVHIPSDAVSREARRDGRTVGFLGRLSVEKAPDLFLEAVQSVECDARVYGDGPLAASIKARAESMKHVKLEGWTDRETALESIDLLLLPSRREALPLSCIEAGARGIPVLARDVGGVREVLEADPMLLEHCLMPADASAVDFGVSLERLLDNAPLREQLGARLGAVVRAHFALPEQVHHLGRVLEHES